jgi:hypothetical protein
MLIIYLLCIILVGATTQDATQRGPFRSV